MSRSVAALVVLAVLAVGCYDTGEDGASSSASSHAANVLLEGDGESVLITAEVADTPEERSRGLKGRKSLADDAGMLFVFFEESTSGFWMEDTLIPLSVAFFDEEGKIVGIRDMKPCTKEPCRVYTPPKPYWGALEVNRGAFEEWGIEVGDFIHANA